MKLDISKCCAGRPVIIAKWGLAPRCDKCENLFEPADVPSPMEQPDVVIAHTPEEIKQQQKDLLDAIRSVMTEEKKGLIFCFTFDEKHIQIGGNSITGEHLIASAMFLMKEGGVDTDHLQKNLVMLNRFIAEHKPNETGTDSVQNGGEGKSS